MTDKPVKVRAQLIAPFLIITLLMLIAWTLTQWTILSRIIENEHSNFTAKMTREWQSVVSATARAQENLLYQISQNTNLKAHFINRDRAAAQAIGQPILNYYEKTSGVKLFYLHQPDGKVFLRVHYPEVHGDTITRQTFLNARQTLSTVSGIESSDYGLVSLRTVQPWYQGDQLIGYLEMGTDMQSLINWVSDSHDANLRVIIDKQRIDKSKWLKQEPTESRSRWDQFEHYLLEASTVSTPLQDLEHYFYPPKKDFTFNKETVGQIQSQIPITNVNGDAIGHLLIDKNFDWLVEEFSNTISSIIYGFIGLIILTCLLYAYFAKKLNERLEFSYRALNTEILSRTKAEEALKEHQKTLENMVANRTRELNVANHKLKEDIELREQTERQLAESTQKYRALFNGSTDIIIAIRDNRIIDANAAAHDALEFANLTGTGLNTLDRILKHADGSHQSAQWLRVAREDGIYRAEMAFNGHHQVFPVEVIVTYINEDESKLYLIACRDISERKAAQAKVEYQALYDPLTDLPNRRLFMEELQRAVQLCRRQNQKGAILFIDLDHFKNINDTLGHSIGDELLKEVAQRLKHCIRAEDTVARFGGDEFVVIIPCCGDDNTSAGQSAMATGQKLIDATADTFVIGEHQLHITPSVGIAVFPKLNETTEDILKQADAALYGAKGDGRNTIRFFEPKMQRVNEERLVIEKELRNALKNEEMFINLQTKHDARGQVIGSECLLRWKHPEMGMVSPFHFISIAEETGFITSIGHWVIEQVAQWVAHCREQQLPQAYGRVAINLSPLQLFQTNFVNDLWSVVQQYQIPPEQITLEITENVLIKDFDTVIKLLQKLKDLGFMISVDDFGTGYSSLRYLKTLPIDELKIDQSFVREIHTNANDRAIAETIISMARHLSLKVVAEGVENKEQFNLLKQQGCDCFQGYYFARPVATGELLDKIRASA